MRQGLNQPWLVLVLAVFGVPLFIGLGATDLANDEAIYSYAVESILTTGDWLSPRSSPNEEVTFVEKPPLKFWIVAAPIKLGLLPYNEFGLRFWDAVFGALAFVYVFLIGRRLAGTICGLFAVLVLFADGRLLFDHGLRSNNMDAALVLAYTGGVYHFLRWGDPGARRWRHIAAVAGWFFLGFMTKFVAALFLPAVLFAAALLIPAMRRLLAQDWWRWCVAGLGVVAFVTPWFVYQWTVLGDGLWRVMFGEHVYTRFTQFADPLHVQPWHFYITEAYTQLTLAGSAIWVGLGLIMVIVHTIRRRAPEGVVILLWLILPAILISLGSSKLYHYFYPYLPPLALAAGAGVAWILSAASAYSLPQRWTPNLSSSLRAVAWGVAALAIALGVATAILGTVRIDGLFRNSSIVRPVVVGLLALTAAGGLRFGPDLLAALLMALLLPTPIAAYGENLRRVSVTRRPLGAVAECLRRVNPERVAAYAPVSEAAFLHPYFYYFRGEGWHGPVDQERLRTALTVDGQQRPVVLEHADFARLTNRNGPNGDPPATIELPTVLVLLPGPFRGCGTAAGSSVR
ncbi:MAG: glycosyltransferase family 39 protein [Acidobacteriota bacterium]|nr:glycosyltransferase family 39 protein [Acidobacteriota bacterium]